MKTQRAFTLVEMLVVISILGLLAALTVPAIKNLGKSNVAASASRQMLDDVGRARQLAMSQRTTVYMIFVVTNFWSGLNPSDLPTATNLLDKQLSGYTFVSFGGVGDQPGKHQWHYLSPWRSLPEGTFIAAQKFKTNMAVVTYSVAPFNYTTNVPFPNQDSTNHTLVPYIAFNYLGQLTVDGHSLAKDHEQIPLARGSVLPAIDVNTKVPQMGSATISETPPGNSTNLMYNMVDIDPLTGRAALQYQRVQ